MLQQVPTVGVSKALAEGCLGDGEAAGAEASRLLLTQHNRICTATASQSTYRTGSKEQILPLPFNSCEKMLAAHLTVAALQEHSEVASGLAPDPAGSSVGSVDKIWGLGAM